MKKFALGLLVATSFAAAFHAPAHAGSCANAATTRFSCPNLTVLTNYGCDEGEVQCLGIFKLPVIEVVSGGGAMLIRTSTAVRVMPDGQVIKHTTRGTVSREVKVGKLNERQVRAIQLKVDALGSGALHGAQGPRCMGGGITTYLGVRSNHYQQLIGQRAMCNDSVLSDAAGHPDRNAVLLVKQLQRLQELSNRAR